MKNGLLSSTIAKITQMVGPLPELDESKLSVFYVEYGNHLVIEHNYALVYASYSGYCDQRL
ncbi:hypothetical protein ACI4BE_30330, partial [Klebsiella pneumoniae]|uniref:hypothetical protein n=1 Tax=Klebsiella pneumoniae TaxID=573 RepID=UPI003854F157